MNIEAEIIVVDIRAEAVQLTSERQLPDNKNITSTIIKSSHICIMLINIINLSQDKLINWEEFSVIHKFRLQKERRVMQSR